MRSSCTNQLKALNSVASTYPTRELSSTLRIGLAPKPVSSRSANQTNPFWHGASVTRKLSRGMDRAAASTTRHISADTANVVPSCRDSTDVPTHLAARWLRFQLLELGIFWL